MPKKRRDWRPPSTGQIIERNGRLYARLRWRDSRGRARSIERRAGNRTEAELLLRELRAEVERPPAETVTFRQIAEEFQGKKLVPPQYAGEARVAGMRSWQTQRGFLRPLIEYFGDLTLGAITYENLVDYRSERAATPTHRGKQRSLAHVNRELSLLRSVLNYAKRRRLISHSPFEAGENLISLADEERRDRLLTSDEEARLLAAITPRTRHYMEPILVMAMDTALRKGEIMQLRWADVDLARRTITVRSTTTKTRRPRQAPISARLLALLEPMRAEGDALVFGGLKDIHKGFESLVKRAGIDDLRFHDLRHYGTTRLIQAGLPPAEVMKITGHTRFETFARYLNTNAETIQRAGALLDRLHAHPPLTLAARQSSDRAESEPPDRLQIRRNSQ